MPTTPTSENFSLFLADTGHRTRGRKTKHQHRSLPLYARKVKVKEEVLSCDVKSQCFFLEIYLT